MKEKRKSRYSAFERRDWPFVLLLIIFPVAQFAVFWVYVNASSIAFAFQDNTTGAFTLQNFVDVWNNIIGKESIIAEVNIGASLGRSVILWLIGELLCFPISLITTYVLTREIFGHHFFRVAYIIPSLIGSIIWCMLLTNLTQMFSGTKGPIVVLLESLGITLPDGVRSGGGLFFCKETGFLTIIIIRFIMGIVGNNAVLTGAFTRVPDELFESAKLDGAGFNAEMFHVAIPCIWSTITTLLIFSLCSVFTCDYNVFLLTAGAGKYDTSTIGFVLFKLTKDLSTKSGAGNYGFPAALGLCLTVITFPVVVFGKKILEKIQDNVEV